MNLQERWKRVYVTILLRGGAGSYPRDDSKYPMTERNVIIARGRMDGTYVNPYPQEESCASYEKWLGLETPE